MIGRIPSGFPNAFWYAEIRDAGLFNRIQIPGVFFPSPRSMRAPRCIAWRAKKVADVIGHQSSAALNEGCWYSLNLVPLLQTYTADNGTVWSRDTERASPLLQYTTPTGTITVVQLTDQTHDVDRLTFSSSHPLVITHAGSIATGVGIAFSHVSLSVCLFVRALTGKRLEL